MYVHAHTYACIYQYLCRHINACVKVHLITIIIVTLHYAHSGADSLIFAQIMAKINVII